MNNYIFNVAQVREIDRIAIEEMGIPGSRLMERAGKRAFRAICGLRENLPGILVLCGSGNNGGDGYVVALCALQAGMDVQVIFTEKPKPSDAKLMCQQYLRAGGIARKYDPGAGELPPVGDLIVDAILGTGIKESPGGAAAKLIDIANEDWRSIVALDVPSGLECNTGVAFDPCIKAIMTVTFIGRKAGCYTADGRDQCGTMIYESLDVALEETGVNPFATLVEPYVLDPRIHNSHKGWYGNLAVFGGSTGMFGAVLLAGRAAMRSGCGLTTVVSERKHADLLAIHCPELMSLDFSEEEGVNRLLMKADSLVIGPGLDDGNWAHQVFSVIDDYEGPMVIDAGGLRLLSTPRYRHSRDNWILTPHAGEAAALLGCSPLDIQHDRIEAAREIVAIYGGVCVLKGSGTVIAGSGNLTPGICDKGNPGMATAGMGDVLSGILGAYVSAGWPIHDCAEFAVWVHSIAADYAASQSSEHSLMASDVIDSLPAVYRALDAPVEKENDGTMTQ